MIRIISSLALLSGLLTHCSKDEEQPSQGLSEPTKSQTQRALTTEEEKPSFPIPEILYQSATCLNAANYAKAYIDYGSEPHAVDIELVPAFPFCSFEAKFWVKGELKPGEHKINILVFNSFFPEFVLDEIRPTIVINDPNPAPAPKPKDNPTSPGPISPGPITPVPVKPEPVKPEPVKPAPVNPEPVKPEPVKPIPVKPEPVKPEPVKPAPVKPEPVKPEPVKPVPVNPAPSVPRPDGIPTTSNFVLDHDQVNKRGDSMKVYVRLLNDQCLKSPEVLGKVIPSASGEISFVAVHISYSSFQKNDCIDFLTFRVDLNFEPGAYKLELAITDNTDQGKRDIGLAVVPFEILAP